MAATSPSARRASKGLARTALALAALCAAPAAMQGPPEVAARAGKRTLDRAELERLLLERHAFSEDGRDILRHLVQTRLIDHLGAQAGVAVGQREINALWDRLDREARKAGVQGGMASELARTGMTPEEFRELLRLQILQQVLTRRALGKDADAPVSGDEMAVWIDTELQRRGLEVLNPPWKDGVVAVCGDVQVPVAELGALLAQHLPEDDVRDAAYHALLLRGIEERMPDLSAEARAEAIQAEVDARRRAVEGDPAYRGVSFESLIGAQGMTVEQLARDPAVAIAALSTTWVDRRYDEDALRAAYEAERDFFEDRYGDALLCSAIFLRAAKFKNRWNPRTFEEAEAELGRIRPAVGTAAAFGEHARALSEDPRSKAKGGELGWVTRGDENVPESAREAAFTWLETGGDPTAEGFAGAVVGPVRLENGVVLLFVSGLRETPGWEAMRENVRQELRRRFLRDVLRREDVRTFRDG